MVGNSDRVEGRRHGHHHENAVEIIIDIALTLITPAIAFFAGGTSLISLQANQHPNPDALSAADWSARRQGSHR